MIIFPKTVLKAWRYLPIPVSSFIKKLATRRFSLTLIEMIIVMILIATITGAIAVNYQTSLDKGRLFATERRAERLRAIAHIYFAEHPDRIGSDLQWEAIINETGLGAGKASDLLQDDWGNKFDITIQNSKDGSFDIDISSERLRNERKKRGLG
jgi:type II secretory pathway pseudopilin PulG